MKIVAARTLPDDTGHLCNAERGGARGRSFDFATPFTDLSSHNSIKSEITEEAAMSLTELVLTLPGHIDSAAVDKMETEFYARVNGVGADCGHVIIDMEETTFLSSLGIRLLVTSSKMLIRRSVPVAMTLPRNEVARSALELSGLTTAIPTYASLAEAQGAFKQGL